MNSWHNYPKVYNMGHEAIAELFSDPVTIQEKVDGSQFSFGLIDGQLKVRSKGAEMVVDAPEKMFSKAVDYVKTVELHEGWTYRGEYLQKPKHNVLAYDRVPINNIIVFDINVGEEKYLPYGEVSAEADRIGLEVVPLLSMTKIDTVDAFKQVLETASVLGGQKIEGVVVKNYSRFGKDGKCLMGKYVSEQFKEVHKGERKDANPGQGDIIQRLIMTYRTPARWQKAVQHLGEQGLLVNEPKDIGALIKEFDKDLVEECKEEIAQELYKWAIGNVLRGSRAGIAEWYKERLLERQFDTQAS